MALRSGRHDEVPKDAVRLTAEEAATYQWKQIHNWENGWDV